LFSLNQITAEIRGIVFGIVLRKVSSIHAALLPPTSLAAVSVTISGLPLSWVIVA
jgi:hypothetical protein